jgi:hypothetical protein
MLLPGAFHGINPAWVGCSPSHWGCKNGGWAPQWRALIPLTPGHALAIAAGAAIPAELRNSTANFWNLRKHRTRARTAARQFLPRSCESQFNFKDDRRKNMSHRSEALADRLEAGAAALAAFASTLSETEWQTRLPKDGRKVGVVVHHVASMYPIEIHLATLLAGGKPVTDVTWDAVDTINRDHAEKNDGVTKEAALALLETASAAAAAAIRAFTDEQLDRAAPVSLNSDAPLTCQFMLEDHAVRHSYHHLAGIRAALGRREAAVGKS